MLKAILMVSDVWIHSQRVVYNVYRLMCLVIYVCIGDTLVTAVKNVGVFFDSAMNMDQHLSCVCRSIYRHLRNIGNIRCRLTNDTIQSLVN